MALCAELKALKNGPGIICYGEVILQSHIFLISSPQAVVFKTADF